MSLKNNKLFETMMSKMAYEFPECSRIHADWEFLLKEKITQEIKNKKEFRILTIQNDSQNYQHVAIIISQLGQEYIQIPQLVEKFLLELRQIAEIDFKDNFEEKVKFHSTELKFTGNVYLYTDKLLVSEDLIQKYFQENGLKLIIRDKEYK
jgi:hypothetical protein